MSSSSCSGAARASALRFFRQAREHPRGENPFAARRRERRPGLAEPFLPAAGQLRGRAASTGNELAAFRVYLVPAIDGAVESLARPLQAWSNLLRQALGRTK